MAAALTIRLDEMRKTRNPRRKEELWIDAGSYAVYGLQVHNLHLEPWQTPPCMIESPEAVLAHGKTHRQYAGAKLLMEMRRCGISDWHHNPLKAPKEKGRGA